MPITPDDLRLVVDLAKLPGDQTADDLPSWAHTLAALIEVAEGSDPPGRPDFISARQPVAFQDVVAPFVNWAVARLREQAGPTWSGLASPVHGALAHALLRQLSSLAAGCLAQTQAASRGGDGKLADAATFTGALRINGLVPFITTYPVLARLIARLVEQWIANSSLFLARLAGDREAVAAAFGGDPGQVLALRPYRSDRHHGGAAVHEVRFASGLHLAYKPKSLAAEQAYADLVAWINAHDPPLPLRAASVLAREGYGWHAWVDTDLPQTVAGWSPFYRRTGMLVCLLHALGGVDFGRDNLVVAGEHPVPIDLETLCHPQRPLSPEADAGWLTSVWRTGLLPHWPPSTAASVLGDVSLLGALAAQPQACLTDHVDDVLTGMAAMQAWLLQHGEGFTAQVQAIATTPMRVILRPTHAYTTLLAQALQPAHLRNGDAFGHALAALDRVSPWPWTTAEPDALHAYEQAALADLDIPLLTHLPTGQDLDLPDGTRLKAFFGAPALDGMVAAGLGLAGDAATRNLAIARQTLIGRP